MLEQAWADNSFTVEGTAQHKIVHSPGIEKRGKKIKIFEMSIYSKKLGLSGKCDCVEGEESQTGAFIASCKKKYRLCPVEFKHGEVRCETEYNVQLCAQAMCMEEMFGVSLERGAIFYINSHRRKEVVFDQQLRNMVVLGSERLKSMKVIPHVTYTAKCIKCSMVDLCMPKALDTAEKYIEQIKKGIFE